MNEANRFLKIANEVFTWGAALPALMRRIGEATKMPNISDADKTALTNASKRIGDIFEKAGKAIDDGNNDDLAVLADQLRDEIVKANLTLDRLRVPDSD
jgi:hypothetical protein